MKYKMCSCRYSSFIAKENERRSTLGLDQDESQMELKDNKELIELGMIALKDTSDNAQRQCNGYTVANLWNSSI